MHESLIQTAIAILGLIVGSAINAFVFRLREKNMRGFLTGRSQCPQCRHLLTARDLIPLVSFAMLRGSCRHCDAKISPHYPIVELTTAVAFGIVTLFVGVTNISHLIAALVFVTVLIVIATYDALWGEIPDEVSLPAIVAASLASVTHLTPIDWQTSLISLVVCGGFFLTLWLVSAGRWMGGGDVRLGALIGAFLGWEVGLLAIFIACAVGSIIGIVTLIATRRKKHFGSGLAICFAPSLAIGSIIALIVGEKLLRWYFAGLSF